MNRRKIQGVRRGANPFGLDNMPHLPPARGSQREKREREDAEIRARVQEEIAAQGGIREPGRRRRAPRGGDAG